MINEIFKNQNSKRSEITIITETGNVFYLPVTLTVKESEEILYALYGEYVDWTTTSERNFTVEEYKAFGYVLRKYAEQNAEKTLAEITNPDALRTYAEEIFNEVLWYDIQNAKEF